MLCRERRSWTAKEDQLLRDAVEREDPENPNPSKWHAIAKHVPNRTNKDCRKRWFAKMASDVVKGGWAPDEDEKLVKGIERYGTRWSLVASVVQSRNSDQCAKRWTDTLNPAIDRTTWSSEADELLLQAVSDHGKVWTKIVKTYFPGRTGLSAKNRYNSITRFNVEHPRSVRPRKKTPDLLPYLSHRKSESVSSSSSSVSPSTPSATTPELPYSPFASAIDSVSENYLFESLSGWPQSSSPSEPTHDNAHFYPPTNMFAIKEQHLPSGPLLPPPSSAHAPHHSFDATSHSSLAPFSDDSHLLYAASRPSSQPVACENLYAGDQHNDHSNIYNQVPDIYNAYPHQYSAGYANNEIANQMALFETLPTQSNLHMGWGNAVSNFEAGHHDRSKMLANSFAF